MSQINIKNQKNLHRNNIRDMIKEHSKELKITRGDDKIIGV